MTPWPREIIEKIKKISDTIFTFWNVEGVRNLKSLSSIDITNLDLSHLSNVRLGKRVVSIFKSYLATIVYKLKQKEFTLKVEQKEV